MCDFYIFIMVKVLLEGCGAIIDAKKIFQPYFGQAGSTENPTSNHWGCTSSTDHLRHQ